MNTKQSYDELYSEILKEHTEVFKRQNIDEIDEFMCNIKNACRIFIMGVGREGIATRSFAMRLMHLGKEVHWIWDDTTPGMHKGDLFIVTNGCGEIGHMHYIVEKAQKVGVKVAIVTGSPNGATAKIADCVLFVPAFVYNGTDKRVVKSIFPMGSLFEQHLFLLFDIIVMLLAEYLGVSQDEMELRHRNIE